VTEKERGAVRRKREGEVYELSYLIGSTEKKRGKKRGAFQPPSLVFRRKTRRENSEQALSKSKEKEKRTVYSLLPEVKKKREKILLHLTYQRKGTGTLPEMRRKGKGRTLIFILQREKKGKVIRHPKREGTSSAAY